MTISVLGAGYVGLTTSAILANCSKYTVYLIEPDEKKLKIIKSGKSYFHEPGLDALIKKSLEVGTLKVVHDYKVAIPKSDIIISCVGTPDNPDGSSNLSYVFDAAKESAKHIKNNVIYVQKSTVPVGTGDEVKKLFAEDVSYVSNPEFLREGSALLDSLWFDRVVVGSESKKSNNIIIRLYEDIVLNRTKISKIANISYFKTDKIQEYFSTSLRSAELIKVTANAFLAIKITFANSIAMLSDRAGANITEVLDAVGADSRIGREFLNAGRGYGGGCFPKDVSGLISSAREYGIDLSLMHEAAAVNISMPGYIVNKLKDALGGELSGKSIAVLGLSFKPGTSDTRKSPAIMIANILAERGAKVSVYDPVSNYEAAPDLHNSITIEKSILTCIQSVHATCVATDWQDFKDFNIRKIKELMHGDIFVDAMNAFDISDVKNAGLQYIGVGRG